MSLAALPGHRWVEAGLLLAGIGLGIAGAVAFDWAGQSRTDRCLDRHGDYPRCPPSGRVDWRVGPVDGWLHEAEPTRVVRPLGGGVEAAAVAVESADMRLRPDVSVRRDLNDRLRP